MEYGVLKGSVLRGKRDTDKKSPHYTITVDGGRNYKVPVNVQSQDGSEVLFYLDTDLGRQAETPLGSLWRKKLKGLDLLPQGYTTLPDRRGGHLGLDFVRERYFERQEMSLIPADAPDDSDLQDQIEFWTKKGKNEDATIYVFGVPFPNVTKATGVHDVHMNQGNKGKFKKDNGVFQDGGVLLTFPGTGRAVGMFVAFQTQKWKTDDNGNPIG